MQKKYFWLFLFVWVGAFIFSGPVFAKKGTSQKEVTKKEKKADPLAQCATSSKSKDDPEVWENCCKSHGGKVKGADFDCDEEAKAKAPDNDEDFIPPDEEEGGLPPAESEE
ncbi:MAG: hypothetical protein A2Z91_06100 [Deltaproteobacteria bacterium GWA2_38_16]|nr:MAG: hypothetical protein A2Z91_06100 [Deltaproteobacteria bacterium GWA2_38_16]OGQ03742.1 MAG: hypothetical protein A3D19_02710 [Deltaproteobacteria bacterium RIFCSPHIGHO2_02_FULL_38_15]OGQ33463.1 MAG: hypothetical protein A3A72_02480 [Deltaproteobacteria bacterium RIFCSPLOWO2_01_FULL_38_9]OGQ61964.1 MAG: hypothetical protein A3G92_06985 [Deltaproteobacteria bacterium RIFCSPLOWO2_12_FULL_38_8]HBQ21304.1 hypothetical protein [Deltaproteobacteria bacterium]